MKKIELTPLEKQAFEMLLVENNPILMALHNQFISSSFISREATGKGFFLKIIVPKKTPKINELFDIKANFCFSDVGANLFFDDKVQEVGFLLWIKDGYLDWLEQYTYGSANWPENITSFTTFYFGGERDLDYLSKSWENN